MAEQGFFDDACVNNVVSERLMVDISCFFNDCLNTNSNGCMNQSFERRDNNKKSVIRTQNTPTPLASSLSAVFLLLTRP